jgi:cellulose synthase operon protein YhjU
MIAGEELHTVSRSPPHALRTDDQRPSPTSSPSVGDSAARDGADSVQPLPLPAPQLGWWSVYFIAKIGLFWKGTIGFHALENLAFAAVLLVPFRSRALRGLRAIVAVPVGAALLYYDSWLPPFDRLVAQASLVTRFSLGYLAELASRFLSWSVVAAIAIAAACYAIVATRIRVGVPVLLVLIGMALVQKPGNVRTLSAADQQPARSDPGPANRAADPAGEATLEAALREHYARERGRQVAFAKPAGGAAPFDLLFLHVCSLSWDDLRATGLENHPFFARLDILLTRFNSAASYSGPAVIRMLRAACGQTSHADLYSAAPEHCYLLPALKRAGFEAEVLLNHDGHFDDLLGIVRAQGMTGMAPLALTGLPIAQRSFDGSPIYDDLTLLARWAEIRRNGSPRAAYFNTISLHDGNRLTGAQSGLDSLATFRIRLQRLLDDLSRFAATLDRDARPTVVVLVPEHGAAFRGDKMQIAGMREIPTPAITLVPAGVMLAGSGVRRSGDAVRIDAPTSHLAIAQIVARIVERPPLGGESFSAGEYAVDLPSTPYLAENAGALMMQSGDKYYLRIEKEGWTQYDASTM